MAINPAALVYVQATEDETLIVFTSGKSKVARESYLDVRSALGQPLPDAEPGRG